MSVSVVTTDAGSATLVVRTGGYDELTGVQAPNGTFEKIQYKIFDAQGKHVATKNLNATGTLFQTALSGVSAGYRVEVQANIRQHQGKTGLAVVRGSATAVPAPDIDLSAEAIEQLVGTTRLALAPVLAGSPNTFVVDFSNTSTTGIAANCVVAAGGTTQTIGPIYIGPGQTKPCTFTLTLAEGTHPVTVNAVIADGYVDANPANNSVSGTIEAKKAADVSVTRIDRFVEGSDAIQGPALGEVVAGGTHTFAAQVSSPAGSLNALATCAVAINGVAVPAEQIEWVTQNLTLSGGSTTQCVFRLRLPAAGLYSISVTATAAGDPNTANNTAAADINVRAASENDPTVNLAVASIRRLIDGDLLPLGEVPSNVAANYVASVTVLPGGNQTSSAFTCSARATNTRTGAVMLVPGVASGVASTTTTRDCAFTLTLSANGVSDETYTIAVTANPIGVAEVAPSNNVATATQRAIVRSDVSVSNVQMIVDGQIQQNTLRIPKGKTATYVVTFNNGSDVPVTYSCQIFAGSPGAIPQAITPASGAFNTAQPGEDKTCTFTYTYSQLVVINFAVSATGVMPLDGDLTNNTATFQTVSQGDQTFPAITSTNVHALQTWITNDAGTPIELVEQSMGVTRITLTFAATTAILGDFKLSGSVKTDGREISTATWTVQNLQPGSGGFPLCRTGVDAGSSSPANHTIVLKICAQEVPGSPDVQAIYVEYSSVLGAPVVNPSPSILFADALTFDVALDWTLYGTTVPDRATASLSFPLQTGGTGFANSYQKTQTGEVTVIRNGGA